MRGIELRDAGGDFAAAGQFAERDQHEGQDRAKNDAQARSKQTRFDRIANEENAAERERDAADPDHPLRAEAALEIGIVARLGRRLFRAAVGWFNRGFQRGPMPRLIHRRSFGGLRLGWRRRADNGFGWRRWCPNRLRFDFDGFGRRGGGGCRETAGLKAVLHRAQGGRDLIDASAQSGDRNEQGDKAAKRNQNIHGMIPTDG